MVGKNGNRPGECDDRFVVTGPTSEGTLLAAVSDGATEAIFSDRWAAALAENWVSDPFSREWDDNWLESPARQLRCGFDLSSLPWFAQEKAIMGSFATLLGLRLDVRDGSWFAQGIGDTVLFVEHPDTTIQIFPDEFWDWEAFGTSPYLLGSNPASNFDVGRNIRFVQGELSLGRTRMMLITDALASWVVRAVVKLKGLPAVLWEIKNNEGFARFIDQLRSAGEIRNDDATMVLLSVVRVSETRDALSNDGRLSTRHPKSINGFHGPGSKGFNG